MAMASKPAIKPQLIADTEITEADVLCFQSYHIAHSRTVRRKTWLSISVILIVWIAVLASMIFSSSKPLDATRDMWPLLCGPPLFLLIFFPLRKARIRRLSKRLFREGRNQAILGRMRVTLSDEGVAQVGEFSSTSVKWPAVEKVVSAESALYIYVGSGAAVIVPRRAFASDEDFEHFGAAARENVLSHA